MLRIMKHVAGLIAATMLLGSFSFAQRRDDDRDSRPHDDSRNRRHHDDRGRNDHHWYNRGRDQRYRDERRHESWEYGDRDRGWRQGEAHDGYYRRDSGNYGYFGGSREIGGYGRGSRGYSFGYQDGAMVAREDMSRGKPYHPDPRGKYEDADHGYDRYYGSKSQYRAQYADGYRQGYVAASRGRY